MSGGKDTFEMLVDEITLIRREIDTLQRTSLNRNEAETLNGILVKSVERMATVGSSVQKQIEASLARAITDVRSHAVEAAESAARGAILKSHAETLRAAKSYSKAAGEARREAWRYFGGFWVWLAAIAALGAILGGLAVFWLQGRADAAAFGKYPSVYCRSAGGEIGVGKDERRFCWVWIDRAIPEALRRE